VLSPAQAKAAELVRAVSQPVPPDDLPAIDHFADEATDVRVEFGADGQAQDVRPAGHRLRYAAEARP
jgi:hypothetical protein